jgi:hypothetical protein
VVRENLERTGALVVRAWKPAGSQVLRARITARIDVLVDEETCVTVAGAEGVSDALHEWLVAFDHGRDGGTDEAVTCL